jgi:hypothetical protein
LSAVLQIYAQENQVPVHKVFRIRREAVKPGHASAHQRHETAVPAALRKAGSTAHYMGMSSLTGPSEVWFIRNYTSIAGWEKSWTDTNKNEALSVELDRLAEQDNEFLTGASELLAVVRDDLSRPRHDLKRLHYFGVTTIHVKPGHEDDFTRLMKSAVNDCQKADCHWSTYQVTAGMPSPAYLVLTSYKNLAELDVTDGAWGEVGQRAIARAQDEGYVQSETQIFKVEPSMSYVVPEGMMETLDPDFWRVKAPAYTPPARKK